jgi:hypothetical protein
MFARVASVHVVARCSRTERVAVVVCRRRSSFGSKVQPLGQRRLDFLGHQRGRSRSSLCRISTIEHVKAIYRDVHVETGWKRERRRSCRDVHSPHLILRLGHNYTRVSTSPKTAIQTPISVSNASVDSPCDWTDGPAMEF